MRRAAILALILLPAAGLVACGSTPEDAASQRHVDLIKGQPDLSNEELARLCPNLYPSDFLRDPGKYNYKRDKTPVTFTSAQLAAARQAGCAPAQPSPAGSGTPK